MARIWWAGPRPKSICSNKMPERPSVSGTRPKTIIAARALFHGEISRDSRRLVAMAPGTAKGPCIICGAQQTSQWKEVPTGHEKYPGCKSWVCKVPDCHRAMGWLPPKGAPGRKPGASKARRVEEPPIPAEAEPTSTAIPRKPPLFIADILEIRGVRCAHR